MVYQVDLTKEHNFQYLLCHVEHGIGEIILNRTQVHNAFNESMIAELICAIDLLAAHSHCQLLLLKANGKHFSAGADLEWMRKQAAMDFKDNLDDAKQLALLMHKLDGFPKPAIALVNGAVFGGALGLVCTCDIAIAHTDAKFCLSEVALGLIPAAISPYVIRAMGARMARRYMITAEAFDAKTAKELNVIHEMTADLDACLKPIVSKIFKNAPYAMSQVKRLIKAQESGVIDDDLMAFTAEQIAQIRVSDVGQEGLNAFFEKRRPSWSNDQNIISDKE